MIDLKELRRRINGEPNEQGVLGPTWLCPREALRLIDALEAAHRQIDHYEFEKKCEQTRIAYLGTFGGKP